MEPNGEGGPVHGPGIQEYGLQDCATPLRTLESCANAPENSGELWKVQESSRTHACTHARMLCAPTSALTHATLFE
eukprot:8499338-Alexandrium_andersonii.AAC.1